MFIPEFTNRFKKDREKAIKQGKDLDRLKTIMQSLINGEPLNKKYRDHFLEGNYKGCRECHIQPDWLLIYRIEGERIVFLRIGSHSELF